MSSPEGLTSFSITPSPSSKSITPSATKWNTATGDSDGGRDAERTRKIQNQRWNTATGDGDGGRDDERTRKIQNQRWIKANSTTRSRSATEIRLRRVGTRQHRSVKEKGEEEKRNFYNLRTARILILSILEQKVVMECLNDDNTLRLDNYLCQSG
ncbi:hypothetical protein AtNW77_Chr3g0176851 [Arabidopsis thaliana]